MAKVLVNLLFRKDGFMGIITGLILSGVFLVFLLQWKKKEMKNGV
ncbi:MAG: hypothetical protein QME51_06465 [Planctomycetota bacterium]|nr:hypothetical protein [Planctomycetota bacterium]